MGGQVKTCGFRDPELGRRKRKMFKMKPEPLVQVPHIVREAEPWAGGRKLVCIH